MLLEVSQVRSYLPQCIKFLICKWLVHVIMPALSETEAYGGIMPRDYSDSSDDDDSDKDDASGIDGNHSDDSDDSDDDDFGGIAIDDSVPSVSVPSDSDENDDGND